MAGQQNQLPRKQQQKKISAVQLGSEHDDKINKKRQLSTGQKRKMKTLAD